MMISFTLPTPPGTNNLYCNAGSKGRVKSAEYKAWISAAGWALKAGWPHELRFRPSPEAPAVPGRWRLALIIPENGRRDIDGYLKPTQDLLVSMGVVTDDRNRYLRGVSLDWDETGIVPTDQIRVSVLAL